MSDAERVGLDWQVGRDGRSGEVRFDQALTHAFGPQSMRKCLLEADLRSPTAALTGRAGS